MKLRNGLGGLFSQENDILMVKTKIFLKCFGKTSKTMVKFLLLLDSIMAKLSQRENKIELRVGDNSFQ